LVFLDLGVDGYIYYSFRYHFIYYVLGLMDLLDFHEI